MALPDRAANVLAELVAERLDGRPLVFVCHSLGGLLVKQLLRAAADQPGTSTGRILDQTQGVVFLATPNAGSDLATWMDRLRLLVAPSLATQDLEAHSPYLRDLNFWYRETAPREDIATLVFVESGQTKGVTVVVDPTSGDPGIPGVRPIPLDADHLSICKPTSREDTLYKSVRRFLEERLPEMAGRGGAEGTSTSASATAPNAGPVQPAGNLDPRVLRRPPSGPVPPDDPCYLEREADNLVVPLADDQGQTIVLKAAAEMGKTSLLLRYLDRCRRNGKRVAFLDFKLVSEAEIADLSLVLTRLAAQLARDGLGQRMAPAITSPSELTEFVEDMILAHLPEPVTVALDDVDRLTACPSHQSLFAMLRGWHNRRASHPWLGWERLDLVLAVATEPSLLIADPGQSPFNVVNPIRLEPFSRSQLARLNADDDGPFGDHLRAKLAQLQRRPELKAAFARLIRRDIQPDHEVYHRLHAAGLARWENGRIVPANLLYARFFGRVLPP
jgi:hypothetical protein